MSNEEPEQGSSCSISDPAVAANDGEKEQASNDTDVECDPAKGTTDHNMADVEQERHQCSTD